MSVVFYGVLLIGLALAAQQMATTIWGTNAGVSALFFAMLAMLVVDAKAAPRQVSFLKRHLPGFGWLDLALISPIYLFMGVLAMQDLVALGVRGFMITLAVATPVFFLTGVALLLRWRRWR
jgi:hypothetical protein